MIARFATLLLLTLSLGACSSTSEEALSDMSGSTAAGAGTADGAPADLGAPGGEVGSSALGGPTSPGSQADLEVNVGDRIFFGFDSSVLDITGRQTVERQAAWLQQFPAVTVTVEGHADQRGTTEYNLALGERRAAAVKSYLGELGIDPARVLTISYGKERLADPAETEEAYALNRRAVTVVNVTN